MSEIQPIIALCRAMKQLLWLIGGAAILYPAMQWLTSAPAHNIGLVALLALNSLIVTVCFDYLAATLPSIPDGLFNGRRRHYFRMVFSPGRAGLAGIIWGLMFGLTVYAGDLMPRYGPGEHLAFALFLALHNVLIGMAVYALCMHLYLCVAVLGQHAPISLWDHSGDGRWHISRLTEPSR